MDALSDVLKAIRVEGAVFINAEFTAPWCIWSSFGQAEISERLRAERLLFFHFLLEGSCKLRVGNESFEAQEGDLVLFSRGERHLMGSDLQLAPVDAMSIPAEAASPTGDFFQVRYGGSGPATRFVCGYIACNDLACRPLLDALPTAVCLRVCDGGPTSLVREMLRVAVRESLALRPGAESTLAKISELLFVEAMRRYVNILPHDRKGWLAGLRDPKVAQALALLHCEPRREWTVDTLASEVALSRSALAKRFTSLVGESPMQYLLRWRLALAADMLRSTAEPIARVALRNGYDSEESFIRAFKRNFGMPPATWRRSGAMVAA